MDKKLDEQLCRDFPEIFRDRHGNMAETCMCWGFEVGNGWEPMIRLLCGRLMRPVHRLRDRIAEHRRVVAETPESEWTDWMRENFTQARLTELEQQLAQAQAEIPVAVQVKEKFGGLRFYVHGGNDAVHQEIEWAEGLSYHVCEVCGTMQDVSVWNLGWVRTLCRAHAVEQYGEDAVQDHQKEDHA